MSDLDQEEDHGLQPHLSGFSLQTVVVSEDQRYASYMHPDRASLQMHPDPDSLQLHLDHATLQMNPHPASFQNDLPLRGPRRKKKHRRAAPHPTQGFHPGQNDGDIDLRGYDCGPRAKKLIKKLDRTCQAQAMHINDLQNDKINLFVGGDKDKKDLGELKTLLSRMEIRDLEGEEVLIAIPSKDAHRVLKMLDESEEEDTDVDEDVKNIRSVTRLLHGVRLDGWQARIGDAVAAKRRERKLLRRKLNEEESSSRRGEGQTEKDNNNPLAKEQVGRDSPALDETAPFLQTA